jgi:hypothetical protein
MNIAGHGGGAPGSAAQVGFKTDANLPGPWDSAMLLHGTQLFAVRNYVMVATDLQSADYEKAKALLAVICTTL